MCLAFFDLQLPKNRKPELPGFGGTGVFVPRPAILEPCSGFYVVTTYQPTDKISGEPNSGLLFYVSCQLSDVSKANGESIHILCI